MAEHIDNVEKARPAQGPLAARGKTPFQAYEGGEPFLFVSYSHSDRELVFPELRRLKALGYNVWYDDGIHAGHHWADQLAERLQDCALTLYFVTPNSALSRHCGNEIHFALELEKPILAIHLMPTVLQPGQRMQLARIQAILKHEITAERYEDKLSEALLDLMPAAPAGSAMDRPERRDVRLPLGVVTLVHIDIDDQQEVVLKLGDQLANAIQQLQSLVRDVRARYSGFEVEMRGDRCFLAFVSPTDALAATVAIQQACKAESWPLGMPIRLRIGVHTGQPVLAENQYFGVEVQRVLGIAEIAAGGQVLLSDSTREAAGSDASPGGGTLRELGSHRLKDMPFPELLYDLDVPGLLDEFEPVASLTNHPSNLPTALASFVGRKPELTEIPELLGRDEVRILTLTGPGGTGKTRLSIEAARRLEREFPGGVFLVHLAEIDDPREVIPAIADTLGARDLSGKGPLDALIHWLGDKRTLLVMDNFEQLVSGATALLDLLQACTGLKLLISSREPLRLRLEREYAVDSLELPPAGTMESPQALQRIEAVELFVERVREFQPKFELSRENADDICAICRKLDGLPLALELAAARLSVLTPSALRENLVRSLDILKSRSRDLPDRQRTLASTVDWSYQLLTPEEKVLFARLSVFRGGFSMTAAQVVLEGLHDPIDLLDDIESLVKKSLLKQSVNQLEPRFWMLETIHDFAAQELLDTEDSEPLIEAHNRYFLELVESLAPGLVGERQKQCVTRVLADLNNVKAAMDRSLALNDADRMGRFCRSLLWFWVTRGYFTEGRSWTRKALDSLPEDSDQAGLAMIHEVDAWVVALSGDYAAAAPGLRQARDLYLALGDRTAAARSGMVLGVALTEIQEDGGLDMCREARDVLAGDSDPYHAALANVTVGINWLYQGDVERAAGLWNQALEVFRGLGNSYWPGHLLQNLAHFSLQSGNTAQAVQLLTEALDLGREYDYPIVANLALAAMAGVGVAADMPRDAARLFGSVQASLDRLGVTFEPLDQAEMSKYVTQLQASMGESSFTEALAEGAALDDAGLMRTFRDIAASAGA